MHINHSSSKYNNIMKFTNRRRPRTIQFTESGFQKIKEDHARLSEKRKEVLVSLQTAREMGDLSENGAYKAARFELVSTDRELRRLNFLIRFGKVGLINHTDIIGFGSTVTLKNSDHTMTFMLVEGYESNPSEHKLSIFSPLGKVLVGKRKGDTVVVSAPSGQKSYTVERVE